ncbi:uncharacterized protein LOC135686454 [Rhopilema esculentum]|uniref:uncharacterized protein LOC135686454 n=1 Tax=Rhopilema esculentum TaxID=499914 RepID=UPI0031DE0D2F
MKLLVFILLGIGLFVRADDDEKQVSADYEAEEDKEYDTEWGAQDESDEEESDPDATEKEQEPAQRRCPRYQMRVCNPWSRRCFCKCRFGVTKHCSRNICRTICKCPPARKAICKLRKSCCEGKCIKKYECRCECRYGSVVHCYLLRKGSKKSLKKCIRFCRRPRFP